MHRMHKRLHECGVSAAVVLAASGAMACQSADQAGSEANAVSGSASVAPPSASAVHGEQPTAETHTTEMEVGYTCADDETFSIAFAGDDQIQITIAGATDTLARTTGHAGLLYANDDIVFYSKGREASVEIGGVPTFTDCVAEGHPE